ncbi:phosphoribosyltransferase family protein [Pontibacter arcticus]|uniref:Phosphoribosyltransferase n=1 Tax=Pontibacter arcticus TaxID=2080288 RepID=A0A364RHL7_9BACT|nr:phosphoribosyltransferase family protein [Pontibacter arcticus]RAU83777.1 phosphoribosyltransferase [Pontibacter arcticus]
MTPATLPNNLILDKAQIEQKIKRIAYEIYERNFEEEELVLAGIYPNGNTLAEMLAAQLRAISPLKVQLLKLTLNKTSPLVDPVEIEPQYFSLTDMPVVLTDDVLNTGRTLAYALHTLLQHNPKKIEVATLVDRHHPQFPVAATYTGYSLATTLHEHVVVVLKENEIAAYLQ